LSRGANSKNDKKVRRSPLIHWLRRFTQFGVGTLLFNCYLAVISTKTICAGPFRNICVPGLNCHACPTAVMGCPIGIFQHFAAIHRWPFFITGYVGLLGLISGRFTCGWLCPFGLVQDVMYRFRRLRIPLPKFLNYLKYAVLVGVVFVIPYFTYEHWFSKLCPCGALIGAIPWGLWNPDSPVFHAPTISWDALSSMYWLKLWILGFFLTLFLFIKRPFCRTVCPLGALYALFNKVSLVSLQRNGDCTHCDVCRDLCPVDLNPETDLDSENCIKCLECTACRNIRFRWNWPWKERLQPGPREVKPQRIELNTKGTKDPKIGEV